MSSTESGSNQKSGPKALPRLDLVVIPVLCLATVLILCVLLNSIATRVFPDSKTSILDCLIVNDPITGVRGKPNTVCREKVRESDIAEYRFNRCGHRAGMECGPKPPGTFRIVMMGSSYAFGSYMSREKTFAALLPNALTQNLGRNIELYNIAIQWGHPATAAGHLPEALAAQPDMILWILTPFDIQEASTLLPSFKKAKDQPKEALLSRLRKSISTNSELDLIRDFWEHRRGKIREMPGIFMLRHLLYENQSQYLKSVLMDPDSDGGFLRSNMSDVWTKDLQSFDRDAEAVESGAATHSIPFTAVLVPNRAQAMLLTTGEWPSGIDPYALDRQLRAIVTRHGGSYVDILDDFRGIPNINRDYFPVDNHPNELGHALISQFLARELNPVVIVLSNKNSRDTKTRDPHAVGDGVANASGN